jgi:hypothetical protein
VEFIRKARTEPRSVFPEKALKTVFYAVRLQHYLALKNEIFRSTGRSNPFFRIDLF